MTDFIACLVCGVKYDQKTSQYCLSDVNANYLHGAVEADWKHMWREADEKTVWDGVDRRKNKGQE